MGESSSFGKTRVIQEGNEIVVTSEAFERETKKIPSV